MMASQSPVVYVDDECVLCNRTAQWIRRRDRQRLFRFASLHSLGMTSPDSVIVRDAKRIYTRSRAVVHILWRLGGWWKVIALLLYAVPAVIRDAAYDYVARHRHRLMGPPQCMLPDDRSRPEAEQP